MLFRTDFICDVSWCFMMFHDVWHFFAKAICSSNWSTTLSSCGCPFTWVRALVSTGPWPVWWPHDSIWVSCWVPCSPAWPVTWRQKRPAFPWGLAWKKVIANLLEETWGIECKAKNPLMLTKNWHLPKSFCWGARWLAVSCSFRWSRWVWCAFQPARMPLIKSLNKGRPPPPDFHSLGVSHIITWPSSSFSQASAPPLGPKAINWAIFCCGILQGGPADALTSAISVDLGKHPVLRGQRAVSTVTGIIDGTGAVGAAVGQYMVGMLSDTGLLKQPPFFDWKGRSSWRCEIPEDVFFFFFLPPFFNFLEIVHLRIAVGGNPSSSSYWFAWHQPSHYPCFDSTWTGG